MSNYETMKDRMSSHFLEYDQEKMIRKFALDHDEKYLYIFFVGRKYRINHITGEESPGLWMNSRRKKMQNYNEAMTIYDVLCNSKILSSIHEWGSYRQSLRCGGNLANDSNFSEMQERNSMEKTAELAKPASGCMRSGWKKAMWLTSWNCFRFFPLY